MNDTQGACMSPCNLALEPYLYTMTCATTRNKFFTFLRPILAASPISPRYTNTRYWTLLS